MRTTFIILLLLLMACTNNDFPDVHNINSNQEPTIVELSYMDSCQSINDKVILNAAKIWKKQTRPTTRNNEQEIETIHPIYDTNNNTIMYVVNFPKNQGFVIFSASKDCPPILAYNDKGNFDIDQSKNTGVAIWLDMQKTIAQSAHSLPATIKAQHRKLWNKYNWKTKQIAITRSETNVYNMIYNQIASWQKEGYRVIRMSDYINTDEYLRLPETEKQTMDQMIKNYGNPYYYSGAYDTSFMLIKDISKYDRIGPLMQSRWGQENGFNTYTPNQNPAGCVAVAVGQILRYYEYPPEYDWNSMEYTFATDATARLLRIIGDDVNTQYSGDRSESNIDNALTALKNQYGYKFVKKVSHNDVQVFKELNQARVVYMRGYDSSGLLGFKRRGHAWVCDGYNSNYPATAYRIETLSWAPAGYEPTSFITAYERTDYLHSTAYFHMNWGWYGNHNGFYSVGDYQIAEENLNFAHGRENIINIYH